MSHPHWPPLHPAEKFYPIVVDLLLRVATDDKGNRFRELEERAAVERREGLAVEFESDGENLCGPGAPPVFVLHSEAAGILEYREIEIYPIFPLSCCRTRGRA